MESIDRGGPTDSAPVRSNRTTGLRNALHRAVTSATQASVTMTPIVIRAAMISASNRAALGATVDGTTVLTCLIGDTTRTD